MTESDCRGASALILGGLLAMAAALAGAGQAHAAGDGAWRPAVRTAPARKARPVRVAAARPLTIRRRAAIAPAAVVGGPGFYGDDYLVRQHSWNDPRLYYFGPFRTGGEVFYGDEAGNPITRGNAGLGRIAGYGPARGGFGGPHFDAVGGFHQGPGPDFGIDSDYASGSLSRPDYGELVPVYPSAQARLAALGHGVVPRGAGPAEVGTRPAGPATMVSFEKAKARFAAPMRRAAPVEAGFANGGLSTIGMQIGNGEF